jgi:hypothetical protein
MMTEEKRPDPKPSTRHERFVSDVEAQLEKGREQLRKSKEQIERSKDLLDQQKSPPKPD